MVRATWILFAILILSGCRGRFSRSAISESTPHRAVSRTEPPAPSAPRTRPDVEEGREDDRAAPMRFLRPIEGRIVLLPDDRRPRGVRFEAPIGASVRAAADGQIELITGAYPSIGPAVLVSHDGGFTTLYGPLRVQADLREGQRITAGQRLGQLVPDGDSSSMSCLCFRLLESEVDVADVAGRFVPVDAVP
jgi:murein DD-endopeptidase MepM/ murein hydrolase activator NlpD